MVFASRRIRLLLAILVPLLAGCTVAQTGAAQPVSGSSSSGSSSSGSAPASAGVDRNVDIPGSGWTSADVQAGPAGIVSPSGDLSALPADGRVCFAPAGGGDQTCADLAGGDHPSFALFSPDGASLLVLAGPDQHQRSVYVIDAAHGSVRVIGPTGVDDIAEGTPPRWDLATVAWTVDSSTVLLAPRTDERDGIVLVVDLRSERVAELGQSIGEMTQSGLTIRASSTGVAMSSVGGQAGQYLWWLAVGTTILDRIARNDQTGGSVYLIAADPRGRFVAACPRSADGHLGATEITVVQTYRNVRLLSDSESCGGVVFSGDSSQLAMTATLDGIYSLVILDVLTSRRILTAPLPFAEPDRPPSLSWSDDVVVVSEAGAEGDTGRGDGWTAPSWVVRLQ